MVKMGVVLVVVIIVVSGVGLRGARWYGARCGEMAVGALAVVVVGA